MSKLYKLSKQEIAEAVVYHIGVFEEGKRFFPQRIVNVHSDEHGNLVFELDYIPQGTRSKDATHMTGWML